MIFAQWTNQAIAGSERIPQHLLQQSGIGMDATAFIEDIPEGTSRDDAKSRLLSVCGIEKTDGLDFRSEWPQEIERQFISTDSDAKRWTWDDLK
jgi:hypothetical protein